MSTGTDESPVQPTGKQFVSHGFGEQTELQLVQQLVMDPTATFADHRDALANHRRAYVAELLLQLHMVDVPRAVKVLALLAAFELRDQSLITALLSNAENYGLAEVMTACRNLDALRAIRSCEKKVKAIRTEEVVAAERPKLSEASTVRKTTASRPLTRAEARARTAERKRARDDDEQLFPRRLRRALAKIKATEQELQRRKPDVVPGLSATLTGSNAEYFRQWASHLGEDSLRHFMLEFSSLQMWLDFTNLVHINPSRMDLPLFLEYAHNPEAVTKRLPADVVFGLHLRKKMASTAKRGARGGGGGAGAASPRGRGGRGRGRGRGRGGRSASPPSGRMTLDSERASIVKHKIPLTLLRKLQPVSEWNDGLKEAVCAYSDITTVFWWIEEFRCEKVEKLLQARLANGELPKFGYGKLMERLMWCNGARSALLPPLIPFAEACLQDYTLPLKTPMAVLGDCSGSMQVAVRTASIIVSLLTALGHADLYFFNRTCVKPPFVPKTIREAIICSDQIVADGSTSPAAALEPLYLEKRRVETLVVVTDELENDPGPRTGLFFADLYVKYRDEVSPNVFLVMVSFLGPADDGDMAVILASKKIKFIQCRLSSERPDLTKLDLLLGKLSMETTMHHVATKAVLAYLETKPEPAIAAAEIKKFVESFVREGTMGIVRFIRRLIINCTKEECYPALSTLAGEFLQSLQKTDIVTQALNQMSGISNLAELNQWCDTEWTTTFVDHIAQNALGGTSSEYSPTTFDTTTRRCGTLTALPREVLDEVMNFVPIEDLKGLEKTESHLSSIARDAKFFAKFSQPEGEFEAQLGQMRGMGLLDMFAEDVVLSTLKTTKGNVEHCIALLFGEGQRH